MVTTVILCIFSEICSIFLVEYAFVGLPFTIKGLFVIFYTLDWKSGMLKFSYLRSLENSLMWPWKVISSSPQSLVFSFRNSREIFDSEVKLVKKRAFMLINKCVWSISTRLFKIIAVFKKGEDALPIPPESPASPQVRPGRWKSLHVVGVKRELKPSFMSYLNNADVKLLVKL